MANLTPHRMAVRLAPCGEDLLRDAASLGRRLLNPVS
jgi:hypothetical protein